MGYNDQSFKNSAKAALSLRVGSWELRVPHAELLPTNSKTISNITTIINYVYGNH
jgi:hypothetical protein